jgi:hypothetical protein
LVGSNDFRSAVGGSIIVNDDLHRKSGFLHEETFDALRNKSLMIIGDAANAYQWHRAIKPLVLANPAWFGQ